MIKESSDEARQKKIPYALMFGIIMLFSTVIIVIIILDYERIIAQPNQLIEDFPEIKEIVKIFNPSV